VGGDVRQPDSVSASVEASSSDPIRAAADYLRVVGTTNLAAFVALWAGWAALGTAVGGTIFAVAFYILGLTVLTGAGFVGWVSLVALVFAILFAGVAIVAGTRHRVAASASVRASAAGESGRE
jgi:hypothetical protein